METENRFGRLLGDQFRLTIRVRPDVKENISPVFSMHMKKNGFMTKIYKKKKKLH